RTVAWAVYLTCCLGFIALVVIGVIRGVMAERAVPGPEAAGSSDPAACAADLAAVYRDVHRQLDAQRAAVAEDDAEANAAWTPLRTRLAALGARCRLREGNSDALARAYQRVQALQHLAESAVQYRHEVGPADLEA